MPCLGFTINNTSTSQKGLQNSGIIIHFLKCSWKIAGYHQMNIFYSCEGVKGGFTWESLVSIL